MSVPQDLHLPCTYLWPCLPCWQKAQRVGWPDPMGEGPGAVQITFCERDRISSDGP